MRAESTAAQASAVQKEEPSEQDRLTGLYQRDAAEKKINELLQSGGVLMTLEVDHFKQLNDRCGHLAGDRCLKEIAQILQYMFFKQDIIGRISGDQFVIYLRRECTADFLIRKVDQLNLRIKQTNLPETLSLTAGAASVCEGDSFQTLLARADGARLAGKQAGGGLNFYSREMLPAEDFACDKTVGNGICTDMEMIRRDLRESSRSQGAYCHEYENFKMIYRFVERGLQRSGRSAYTVLLTLTDEKGEFLGLDLREHQMEKLRRVIQGSLRAGDIFTQYSSGQYLLMVPDTSADSAGTIGERIRTRFNSGMDSRGICLQQGVYPLEAVAGGPEENPT